MPFGGGPASAAATARVQASTQVMLNTLNPQQPVQHMPVHADICKATYSPSAACTSTHSAAFLHGTKPYTLAPPPQSACQHLAPPAHALCVTPSPQPLHLCTAGAGLPLPQQRQHGGATGPGGGGLGNRPHARVLRLDAHAGLRHGARAAAGGRRPEAAGPAVTGAVASALPTRGAGCWARIADHSGRNSGHGKRQVASAVGNVRWENNGLVVAAGPAESLLRCSCWGVMLRTSGCSGDVLMATSRQVTATHTPRPLQCRLIADAASELRHRLLGFYSARC